MLALFKELKQILEGCSIAGLGEERIVYIYRQLSNDSLIENKHVVAGQAGLRALLPIRECIRPRCKNALG